MGTRRKTRDELRREKIRDEHWADTAPIRWPPSDGKGWFKAPRVLPVLLQILTTKSVVATGNPSNVYIELLSNAWEDGLLIITNENEHARLAGYGGSRGLRTWRDGMKMLVDLGFIRVAPRGDSEFGYVLIVNPYIPVKALREAGKVDDGWWNLFTEKWSRADAGIPAPTESK
jgi:hypothetical protein